ncbi:uncharacterized protein LOC129975496 [Argiope bruennichi]|uniref:uncharacterized protein LOC129975496 n=1 Tax=Argiope bruennichi TaxID=94029 RepID=UPI002493DFC4|nr:uncharacterized protein LOC129975496 [Argiope bruennichi]
MSSLNIAKFVVGCQRQERKFCSNIVLSDFESIHDFHREFILNCGNPIGLEKTVFYVYYEQSIGMSLIITSDPWKSFCIVLMVEWRVISAFQLETQAFRKKRSILR